MEKKKEDADVNQPLGSISPTFYERICTNTLAPKKVQT
jgi:hypothetical protein